MKRVLFLPPLLAAILFTIPQAFNMLQDPADSYVPVVYEALIFIFSFAVMCAGNLVLILPLSWLLIRLGNAGLMTTLVFGLVLAFVGDVVAYAFEIFDYQPSIFHPAYLYGVFLPLLVLAMAGHFLLAMHRPAPPATDTAEPEEPPGERE